MENKIISEDDPKRSVTEDLNCICLFKSIFLFYNYCNIQNCNGFSDFIFKYNCLQVITESLNLVSVVLLYNVENL